MTVSTTHLVILPAYNAGPRLREVVESVLREWQPVLVVIDGSTDASEVPLLDLARTEPELSVQILPRNTGKGAAVLAGAKTAKARGFTHALVMDADGQHPTGSINEFMAASQAQPDCLVLGRPVFPSNIPLERLYCRKLSVGLVHLELLGRVIADPLFGFRVYPLGPLLDVLGPRRGGRRYDFDTEAAVRLGWAGVRPVNLSAPVRYFSRAEGGITHYHYVRDNLTMAWMHARLLTELLFRRWPALLSHHRRWRQSRLHAAVMATGLVLMTAFLQPVKAIAAEAPVGERISAANDDWSDLVKAFRDNADLTAEFTERRHFPFRREPVTLPGEVRVSLQHGLSLHYTAPEQRTVILDASGMLVRTSSGETIPPADPRAAAANRAMFHILSFNIAALEQDFELHGQREGSSWTLVLVPHADDVRRALGRITVSGESATVRRIELRRSTRQFIEITIDAPRPPARFTAEERSRYFR